jgi:hypothetical protein
MRREYRYAISAGCGAALLLFAAVPESSWNALPVVCLFRNAFGFECFGCGMTRALAFAMHGDFPKAMEMNSGVLVAAPGLLGGVLQGLRVRS